MVLMVGYKTFAEDISPRSNFISYNAEAKIEIITQSLFEVTFDLCSDCYLLSKMSSIPQGMFAATKARENFEKSKMSRVNCPESAHSQKYFFTKLMELSPLKYNSKLMNSIWGLYNRYSPHNIKRTNDEAANLGDLQQASTVNLSLAAPPKDAPDGLSRIQNKQQNNVPNLDNFWTNIPMSHS